MSMSSFSLKGGGWYTTDYKRSAAPTEAETASNAPNTKDSADAPSSEKAITAEKANGKVVKGPKAG
jgi:hypothetical protein